MTELKLFIRSSLLVTIALAACAGGVGARVYVAPDGDDAAPGTIERPFRSLARARDAVRELKGTGAGENIAVVLRGGYYRLEKTVVFGLEDSAAPGRKITYMAHPGEKPVLGSGLPVTGWEKVESGPAGLPAAARGNVWRAPLPKGISFCSTLFDGEEWLPRARGRGFVPTRKWSREQHGRHKQDLHFPTGAIPADAPERGAEVRVVPSFPWVVNVLDLERVDAKANIAYTSVPATYGLGRVSFGHFPEGTCWLENAVEALDRPGEWVLDAKAKCFYLWPKQGRPSGKIVAPALTELVRVEGKIDYDGPKDRPVQGLRFEGLTFTHADHWRWRPDKTGWGLQHDWEMFDRPTAMLRFRGAENCEVHGCEFANSGAAAVRCDLHATGIGITRSRIHHVGGIGVLLAGYGPGTKDVNRKNIVEDNHIHDVGLVHWHSPAVWAWQSGHNRIAHNNLHHVPYSAVLVTGRISWNRKGRGECGRTVRWDEIHKATGGASKEAAWGRGPALKPWRQREPFMHSRHNVIEKNDIHHCMQILGDGNAVYVSGCGDGNIVQRNYIHDIDTPRMNATIRCDDDQHGTIMRHNLLVDCCGEGFIIKGANTIENNVIYAMRSRTPGGVACVHNRGHWVFPYNDCTGAVLARNILFAVEKGTPLLFEREKGRRTPGLLRQCRADRNIYFNSADPQWGHRHLARQRKYGIENSSVCADPLFRDPARGDFRFRPGSPAPELGIEPLVLDDVGVRKENNR